MTDHNCSVLAQEEAGTLLPIESLDSLVHVLFQGSLDGPMDDASRL